tara:strand:+ start:16 stop:567 length:552 start_codon:yes stop_codon:yes gene_type:complete
MRITSALTLCLLLAAPFTATADARFNVGQCAGLEDLELRLACFDALKNALSGDEARGEIGRALRACTGGELGRLDCYDGVARAEGLAPEATVAVAKSASKSSSNERRTIPKTFKSVLTGAKRGMTGVFMLELENGQVWRELEPTPGANYRVGDELTFKKGYFGAYRVKNERTNIGTKVKVLRR